MNHMTTLRCIRGQSLERPVLLGFASARVLHAASFADVLDEASGRGYQRRLNSRHSLDFRRYVQAAGQHDHPAHLQPARPATVTAGA